MIMILFKKLGFQIFLPKLFILIFNYAYANISIIKKLNINKPILLKT